MNYLSNEQIEYIDKVEEGIQSFLDSYSFSIGMKRFQEIELTVKALAEGSLNIEKKDKALSTLMAYKRAKAVYNEVAYLKTVELERQSLSDLQFLLIMVEVGHSGLYSLDQAFYDYYAITQRYISTEDNDRLILERLQIQMIAVSQVRSMFLKELDF